MRWYCYISISLLIFTSCLLIYSYQMNSFVKLNLLISKSCRRPHNAIILARRPTTKLIKHVQALLHVGVNAFLMSDENPSNFTNITDRIIYINDQTLDQLNLKRNRVWDRVFVWLYNQTSLDYVWLMEDDVTWDNIHHIVNLFEKYANYSTDLLARNIINLKNETKGWIFWPKSPLKILPKSKWSGSLNMLCRVSRRLIKAHEYYIYQFLNETKQNPSRPVDSGYYFQEFFIPTVANMFNLTMLIFEQANMVLDLFALSEEFIGQLLPKGKQIFHPVKHDSRLLINATAY